MISLLKNKKVVAGLLLLVLALFGYAYSILYMGNVVKENYELKIKSNTSYDALKEQLTKDGVLKNISNFDLVSSLMNYKKNEIPSGRYLIRKGMSNRKLISKLRSGDQDALDLTFNNVRTIQELAGALSKQLESDSLTLLSAFINEKTLQEKGLNAATALTMYIPNTYDVFWNISPEKFIARMKQEADDFWTKERLNKLKNWNLNKEQAYTLASIVEKESNNKKERPTVAGVYLNRLKIGDKLRADPTVVFAIGDFNIRRVLFEHLEYDSPYNTYKYSGLPPGPIYMPSVNALESVINAEKHDYFFFCAKPGYNSEHAFAKTAEQHQVNANVYHKWLASEGIK